MHPREVLFAGEVPPRRLPVVDHYCGVEKLMRRSLALQAARGPVFDVTLDCEDGAAAGAEAEHVRLVRELLEMIGEEIDELGIQSFIKPIEDILAHGTSADRQLRVYDANDGDIKSVVDHLILETKEGV